MNCKNRKTGNFVERLIATTGKSQRQISEETGISEPTLSKWATGQSTPRADSICEISKTYGISADYLLGLSDNPRSDNGSNPTVRDLMIVIDALENRDLGFLTFTDSEENFGECDDEVCVHITDDDIYKLLQKYVKIKDFASSGTTEKSIFDEWFRTTLEDLKKKPLL